MSHTSEPREDNSIEVAVIPESKLSRNVGDAEKAKMAQGSPLLCFLGSKGELTVGDIADSEALGQKLDGTYSE